MLPQFIFVYFRATRLAEIPMTTANRRRYFSLIQDTIRYHLQAIIHHLPTYLGRYHSVDRLDIVSKVILPLHTVGRTCVHNDRILTYFVRRSVTVQLTFCLNSLDASKKDNLMLIQHKQNSLI